MTGAAILGIEQPFHPIGQPFAEYETDGFDMSIFTTAKPSYAEVLEVRAGRVAMVRDFITGRHTGGARRAAPNPWAPEHQETVLACLGVILSEEWDHLRYAVRDLDTLEARSEA